MVSIQCTPKGKMVYQGWSSPGINSNFKVGEMAKELIRKKLEQIMKKVVGRSMLKREQGMISNTWIPYRENEYTAKLVVVIAISILEISERIKSAWEL